MGILREGHSGKDKGIKQVLWKHGWFLDGKSTAATIAPEMNTDTGSRQPARLQE